MNKIWATVLILALTILSGIADSQGFLHASIVWKSGKFIWKEAGKSLASFIIGIIIYWFAIKYMQRAGLKSAEIQTSIWFAITIIGVAFVSGKFFQWNISNQLISILVLIGIGILIFRTGG
ncbi:hypothetical protein A2954_05880 [Candidatus Roizmanbacteria bacterium RIFCSPLOWO2_01_FULL_37_12]|uniref:EamA domain-containing protein n=1 Tax=Candidatus Roizmanbacteria bacterium RIFCSPLOWO2_01_FULL_37_12 TaxID=1802056 RepID=A0A1F7IBU6_9BACT|nr:MAG: hypothetical protein A2768_02620 [Candidatus Roizmanbacteria bacterium RIFCSPHIGHO2_01_FULL_37_16]OGK25998.1 MAG: hypothetical protein A3D76_03495 [Candidatus Roizmanbacteria bacterium RIFCSPHIGHO2_02_FULL_37_9b]OGK40835.1 MAG: hypothetical protein A2954_05880 [Candidatus Roizmanbacteria bacterium RIFCSPLOWO2_01_FULL_37_12]